MAVIDTGIYVEHPCLKRNLWINQGEIPDNKVDDDGNGFVDDIYGWNFVNNNNNVQDEHGHGSHISGIIAATGKTSSTPYCQVIGVAPNVTLMTIKYYDSKNHKNNVRNTIKAIKYAVDNGAHIINYSGGGPGANDDEKAVIAKAADKGVIFISASGNESSEISALSKYYPASYNLPNIVSLNSKDDTHEILDSSNWIKIDWRDKNKIHNQTAPGKNIVSTLPPPHYLKSGFLNSIFRRIANQKREKVAKSKLYGYMTGTSQATAITSGVVALIKSKYPHWTATQVIRQINNTGYGEGNQRIRRKTNQGKKLNAYEAMIMRDQNIDFDDRPSKSSTIMPATNKASVLKSLGKRRGSVDVYDPSKSEESPMKILNNINKTLSEKK